MPTSVLAIDGITVDRTALNVRLNRLVLFNLDAPDTLEFSEGIGAYPPTWPNGATVTLTIDGVAKFRGEIITRSERWGETSLVVAYRCAGLKFVANKVPITEDASGRGRWLFNLPRDDPEYEDTLAGRSVGNILTTILTDDQIAADLWAAGIEAFTAAPPYDTGGGTPAMLKTATVADLGAMTVVPRDPVQVAGSRLWNRVEALLQDWSPKFSSLILPEGTIRFVDTTDLDAITATLHTDPIDRPDLERDTIDVATRVVVRGDYQAEGWYGTITGETLEPDFTTGTDYATNEDAILDWNWESFVSPEGAVDEGILTDAGTTTVTIKSDDLDAFWAINRWSDDRAIITLENPLAAGTISYSETRRVTANAAMSAGGTCVLTLDTPLAATGFVRYRLVGRTKGGALTYRRYHITDAYARDNLLREFPEPFPYSTSTGAQFLTRVPVAHILYGGGPKYLEWPGYFEIDRINGDVIFHEPVVRPANAQSVLDEGGAEVVDVADLRVFLPISKGLLTATKPAAGFEGQAYDVDGIERTLYIDLPTWRYKGDQSQVEEYAQMILDTTKDPVVTGQVSYRGYWTAACASHGLKLNIAHVSATTGYEALGAVIRSVSIAWPAAGGLNHETTVSVSTRRRPWTGDRYFEPREFAWGGGFASGGFLGAAGQAAAWMGGAPNLWGGNGAAALTQGALAANQGVTAGALGAGAAMGRMGTDAAAGMAAAGQSMAPARPMGMDPLRAMQMGGGRGSANPGDRGQRPRRPDLPRSIEAVEAMPKPPPVPENEPSPWRGGI